MDPSQSVHLPGFLHSLEPTLNHYGYLAVAGFVLLEDFGVPVPGETILILGAVFAGAGRLNIWLVGLLGFLAAVAGDNIGFGIGHFGGRALVERYGRYIFLTPERLDKTTNFFERHGGWIIVVARFIEGLRQANGIIAGTTGMHWAKFLAFNVLGAALWVAVWTSVGYFAGNNITSIYNAVTRYTLYVVIGAAVLLLAWIGRRLWRKRKERAARGTQAEAASEESRAQPGAPSEEPQAQEEAPREERQARAGGEDRGSQEPQALPSAPSEQSQARAEAASEEPHRQAGTPDEPPQAPAATPDEEPQARAGAPDEERQARAGAPDEERQARAATPDEEPQARAGAPDEPPQARTGSEDGSS